MCIRDRGTDVSLQIGLPNNVTVGNNLTVTNDALVSNDLTVTGNLTVNGTTTSIDTTNLYIVSCDTYLWDGITYSNSGIYDSLYQTSQGCDSLVILDLTINTSSSTFDTVISCDSYNFNGTTYYVTGSYVDTLSSIVV